MKKAPRISPIIAVLIALALQAFIGSEFSAYAQLSEEEKQERIKMIEKRVNDQTYEFLDKMGDLEKETVQSIGRELQRFFYHRQMIQAKMQAARQSAGDNPQQRRAAMMPIREELTTLYAGLRKSAKGALDKKELKQFNKVLSEMAPEPQQGRGGPGGGGGRGGGRGGTLIRGRLQAPFVSPVVDAFN